MSIQLLLQTDYISVVWEVIDAEITSATCKDKQQFIRLFFTIQVNWKIKTTNHSFLLEKSEFNEAGLSLKNWNEWYNVYHTLKDLWYSMWDDSDPIVSGSWVLNQWITILTKY